MAPTIYASLDHFFQEFDIHTHKNISFHHHLRNGDFVINDVLAYYIDHNVQHLHLFPSSIFPSYTSIMTLLEHNQIDHITTNYINGPVGDYLSTHGLPGQLTMQTHGGRARSIIEGKQVIDVAYIACPTVDSSGNGVGYLGPSKCGSLGYAIADSIHAKKTILITDHLIEDKLEQPEIIGTDVDGVIVVDHIGNPAGIVSGTTNITTNPIGVKIARLATQTLIELGAITNGFSYQSGAGGISLRVTKHIGDYMKEHQITASFFSGGITTHHVRMLEEGLVERLYDVQCFDLDAVDSIATNPNHIAISASRYANPQDPMHITKDLDIVILGATEIDCDFNVNVTTDSHQTIIGGSGGHSDTASDSSITVIVSPLLRGRLPLIKDRVTTITTLGQHVDILVTERGIAIHPQRTDLRQQLAHSSLPIFEIQELQQRAYRLTGTPRDIKRTTTPIGVIEDRTYDIIDTLYQKK
ncbi:citrate lyase subunit alpha [Candidatus Xianfuyuplasma coldseepsis]|uniref:Citrate lyase subunit alpha n=1 Tax=Candidatus Xianfuyuplasma coldseepsis TaxID=2782163 RepID=A0A7L7KNR6_9MOLU|nr:citrate lyase subunit alpha [Xianfuyuplasma coldseepsis]QMS84323.1 citrate lyase subunit alpha [Xianfuyuplasma coldseepsis]